MTPTVSVVIRNRNESDHLRHVLKALRSQTVDPEIIVVDNESTDNSREIASQYGARVILIARNDFTFGRALNIGIAAASADLIINLSAHALPLGAHFIDSVISRFGDPRIAAVQCNDIRYIDNHFDWMSARQISGDVQWREIWQSCIVNTCCGIRKAVWNEIPFDETLRGAEDPFWSFQALRAGYSIRNSDAYYWYMYRRPLYKSLVFGYREALEQYRFSGTRRVQLSFTDVFRECVWRIPKTALRSIINSLGWYVAINLARFTAKRHPFPAAKNTVAPQ
jgi:glycosyltransferase involved in cell wall biosynthesis